MKRLLVSVVVSIAAAVGALVGAGVAHAVEYPEGNFELELAAPAAQPGGLFTISGGGGAPGETVTLFMDTIPQPTGGDEVQIGTATVNPDGTWTVSGTVPGTSTGSYAGRVVVPVLVADPAGAAAAAESAKDGVAQPMRIEYQQQSFVLPVTVDGLLPVVGGGDPFPTLRLAAGLVVAGMAVALTVVRRRRLAV